MYNRIACVQKDEFKHIFTGAVTVLQPHISFSIIISGACHHGPLARYVKLRIAHAPGMPGTFSPATAGQRSRYASRHVRHARAVMHVGIASQQFPLKSEAEKRSRHSRRMRNPQFCVSGKRSMIVCLDVTIVVTVTISLGKSYRVQFQPDYNNNATLTTMLRRWGPRNYLRCQKMMILCSSFVELKGLKSCL